MDETANALLNRALLAELHDIQLADGRTLLQKVGTSAAAESVDISEQIRTLLVHRDVASRTELARLAHQLKGTMLLIGATKAAAEAESLTVAAEQAVLIGDDQSELEQCVAWTLEQTRLARLELADVLTSSQVTPHPTLTNPSVTDNTSPLTVETGGTSGTGNAH